MDRDASCSGNCIASIGNGVTPKMKRAEDVTRSENWQRYWISDWVRQADNLSMRQKVVWWCRPAANKTNRHVVLEEPQFAPLEMTTTKWLISHIRRKNGNLQNLFNHLENLLLRFGKSFSICLYYFSLNFLFCQLLITTKTDKRC